MSEIEKMYDNAGVEPKAKCNSGACIVTNPSQTWCKQCESLDYTYPPFTAEKQLKIIVFLVNKGYNVIFANLSNNFSLEQISKSLALCINSKWNNLTESDRTEIRSILNG